MYKKKTNKNLYTNRGQIFDSLSIEHYYMGATIVRAPCLAAERARFSCNDRGLLARCQRHIPSVFNIIVDINVIANVSCPKKVSADQSQMTVSIDWAQVHNSMSYPLTSYWF